MTTPGSVTSPAPARRSFSERFPRWKPMLLLALLVVSLNATTVREVSAISPIDEQLYIDHLFKAADLSINQAGDELSTETLQEYCQRKAQFRVYKCEDGTIANPDKIGLNYVQAQPLYFFVTGLAARALKAISPVDVAPDDSLITYARLLGAAWLLLGCYLVLRIVEMFRIRRRYAVAGLAIAIATPALLHATTIVNPDAASFTAGAAVVLASLAWERRRVGWWAPLLATLFLAGLKLPNTAAIGIVLVYFAARALMRRHADRAAVPAGAPPTSEGDAEPDELRPVGDYVKVGLAIVVGAVLAIKGWEIFNDFLPNLIGDPDVDLHEHPERIKLIIDAYRYDGSPSLRWIIGPNVLPRLLPPIDDTALPVNRVGGLFETMGVFAKYLFLTPVIGLLFVAAKRWRDRLVTLGLATLVGALVMPPLFVLYWNVVQSTNDAIYPRYGLSILPLFVLLLVAAAQRGGKLATYGLYGFAGVAWLAAVLTNFTSSI